MRANSKPSELASGVPAGMQELAGRARLLATVSYGCWEADMAGGPRGKWGMSYMLFCVICQGGFTDCGEHMLLLNAWENFPLK